MPSNQDVKAAWRSYHEISRNLMPEHIELVEQDEPNEDVIDSFKLMSAHEAWKRAKSMELESEA